MSFNNENSYLVTVLQGIETMFQISSKVGANRWLLLDLILCVDFFNKAAFYTTFKKLCTMRKNTMNYLYKIDTINIKYLSNMKTVMR